MKMNLTFLTELQNIEELELDVQERDPLYIVIPVTVAYAIIFVSGLVGNVCTCIVISRNKHMHTGTNYYLFSLAISDLLLLVSGLPQEMYNIWYRYPYTFGETFCILQGFAAETSANATVLTITAFTVERYVAICHPFQEAQSISKLSRAFKFVIIIWILAIILAAPQAMQFGVVFGMDADGSSSSELAQCTVKWVLVEHVFEISTLVFFIVPMTIITILYILIGIRLRKSKAMNKSKRSSFTSSEGPRNGKNGNHVIRMLVAVVVAFFICWAPFHAQRLLAIHNLFYKGPHSTPMLTLYTTLTYVSGVLYYLSTTINPILYQLMSYKFREAFKMTIVGCCSKNNPKRSSYDAQFYRQSLRLNVNNNTHTRDTPKSLKYQDSSSSITTQPSENGTVKQKMNEEIDEANEQLLSVVPECT